MQNKTSFISSHEYAINKYTTHKCVQIKEIRHLCEMSAIVFTLKYPQHLLLRERMCQHDIVMT